jgi:hypothetical protein
MTQDYSVDLQKLFIEFMVADQDLFVRCNGITDSDFFDRQLRPTIRFIKEHSDTYASVPTITQIKAKTGLELEGISDTTKDHREWFLDEYETFCRHKALEKAILASAEKLEKKEYGAVEHLIKEAVSIGLPKKIGLDYWKNPYERLKDIQNNKPAISTGWKAIDTILYGGFERGTLNIFAAPSGHGKSLFLQNISLNWALAGFNVIYVSLELSEKLCSMRFDSMLTGYGTRDLFKNIDDVSLKLGMIQKKAGQLQVVQLPNGINVNDLKAYVKEYSIQTGIKVDGVIVDYLDLMTPARQKVQLSDVSLKDKLVSEELRNFSIEGDYLFATASQINRCLTLDTKVKRNGKDIDIKDINVGDWIESSEGPVKVKKVYPVTIQDVYQIKTASGKIIECSANHIFPTLDGNKTLLTGLKIGDKLKVIVNTSATQENTNEKYIK